MKNQLETTTMKRRNRPTHRPGLEHNLTRQLRGSLAAFNVKPSVVAFGALCTLAVAPALAQSGLPVANSTQLHGVSEGTAPMAHVHKEFLDDQTWVQLNNLELLHRSVGLRRQRARDGPRMGPALPEPGGLRRRAG